MHERFAHRLSTRKGTPSPPYRSFHFPEAAVLFFFFKIKGACALMAHAPFVSSPCLAAITVFVFQNLFYGQLPLGVPFFYILRISSRRASRLSRSKVFSSDSGVSGSSGAADSASEAGVSGSTGAGSDSAGAGSGASG